MNISYLAAAVLAGAFLCGCKKKQPETIPQPKAEEAADAAADAPAPAEPAAREVEQNPLKAGEKYLKTTVGQVDKAKAAAAVYEDAAKEHFKGTDVDDAGGN